MQYSSSRKANFNFWHVHTLRSVFVNSPPPKPEVILTNFFVEPTVLLVPITSRAHVTVYNLPNYQILSLLSEWYVVSKLDIYDSIFILVISSFIQIIYSKTRVFYIIYQQYWQSFVNTYLIQNTSEKKVFKPNQINYFFKKICDVYRFYYPIKYYFRTVKDHVKYIKKYLSSFTWKIRV